MILFVCVCVRADIDVSPLRKRSGLDHLKNYSQWLFLFACELEGKLLVAGL